MDSESANSSSPPPAEASVAETADSSSSPPAKASVAEPAAPAIPERQSSSQESPTLSTSGISSWARNLKLPQPLAPAQENPQTENATKSPFARLASGFGLHLPAKDSGANENSKGISTTSQSSIIESFAKGLVDSSMSAVKAVQVKARHIVSQNKRRYQEGGFDLDMTYITENIIAMGFPAGDMSSGFFGYVEGFYRNHMEEVIKFFETHHKGKYKVYNLCSERLYDASLFEGKVATFPFDDHNCPPIQLITSFCQSAHSWLKDDILNVVVVHCKAGMARTGLMISSLLLFLKLFPTAEECIDYYNQKRCVDGKALVLPSQIRYVKYFERLLTNFNGENQPGRRCILRGFRFHKCPYWIRPSITISDHNGTLFSTRKHPKTKDLMPEDFWIRAPKKGIVVFALPGEPGLTELMGDFKIHFHDRHGEFYCWLNTTMMENRIILKTSDLDGFEERKIPCPGFMVEIVMIDYDGTIPTSNKAGDAGVQSDGKSVNASASTDRAASTSDQSEVSGSVDNDDVFSDSDGEENVSSKSRKTRAASEQSGTTVEQMATLTQGTQQMSLGSKDLAQTNNAYGETKTDGVERSDSITKVDSGVSDIKAIAADASVFSFGCEEDYESE
ncbi:phosphatidylinositol 3,4,5-trisphosphate 3-phosphatase and protein-tyrosine-phosphatase PTEN2A-like [Cornus florida]|uniref:phosphatidylinositol 3,4,5-trisphosphate 3-phosphatase and protein-tyrosine-phosphatase PTEN2A-like n=1 Tax=Cornus florida TaxID=4283 RepID=UPI00289ECFED|nr:phosphatidylinositol 3,4,5-trisphosphate 3-phosphatase and protein-tyrosine-phosphatase PTEN2A-like [Cornus florida]XP_059623934.1 phosphatidylinositol 3,4,5-trisphosphate 3-phosphatase and protein-tyrosine-phosphatase PTEN2A-like [Cornus florida]XP_059623935.1 phosphatidylinositol 3,4,5-trisphosphate 3-phosphatase and protein-tyrosine-phosphatase PTEN2A-like [Cornus florida]